MTWTLYRPCLFVQLSISTAAHRYSGSEKQRAESYELRENALALLSYNMCCIKQDELWQLASVCYSDDSNQWQKDWELPICFLAQLLSVLGLPSAFMWILSLCLGKKKKKLWEDRKERCYVLLWILTCFQKSVQTWVSGRRLNHSNHFRAHFSKWKDPMHPKRKDMEHADFTCV